jgi:hypothetical protein
VINYKAKATATSIIARLPEVKQAEDKIVNNYFSRANKILWELKTNIDPNLIEIPDVVLPADMAQQWTALPAEVRTTVINHTSTHAAAGSCEQYNAIILTAGFNPSIKTKIMGANLTGLADIKDRALKTETLEIEKRGKPNNPNLLINQVEETNQDVDALKFEGQRGGFNRGFQGEPTQYLGNGRGQNYRGCYNNARGNQTSNQNNQNRGKTTQTTHRLKLELRKHQHPTE